MNSATSLERRFRRPGPDRFAWPPPAGWKMEQDRPDRYVKGIIVRFDGIS